MYRYQLAKEFDLIGSQEETGRPRSNSGIKLDALLKQLEH